jgi:valyl-tRNA synthetase
VGVLDGIVRLVHPIMPFLAESLWEYLGQVAPERGFPMPAKVAESVCIAPWPTFPAELIDASTEAGIARMQDLIKGVREIRNRYQLEKPKLALSVKCSDAIAKELLPLKPFIVALGNLISFEIGPDAHKPPQAGSIVRPEYEAYIALAGLIDPAAEAKRLEKQIVDLKKQIAGMASKLGNESYVKNAPPEVVTDTREKVKELEGQVKVLETNLVELKA